MKVSELLLEYNEMRLINDFGNKLVTKYASEFHTKIEPNKLIEKISALDPTPNKELTFWLVLNYANNRISRFEDIAARAIPALLKFKALLRKPNLNPPLQIRDINQIKGLSDLENIIEKYTEKQSMSSSEQTSGIEQELIKTNQVQILYNDSQLKVISPKTEKASCFYGIGTRWCTAAKNGNMFSDYNSEGPLYIIVVKGTNKKYQFHFQSKQFMNAEDKKINPRNLAKTYPILWKIFSPISEQIIV